MFLAESTTSIATTPVPSVFVAPCAGILRKVYAAAGGTTTGTTAVAVSVNGGADVTGGGLTIAAGTGARIGSSFDLAKVGVNVVRVNEGDVITFTPSGGTGASIPGAFAAVIRPNK
ncbi:hypothetical protein [Bradyrhizobium pachyrhizi]|uniref:hypothetical protein n=1 Tax=Bradyrhizobium pachyrhizi TaxID=280333 RepID=UPI0012E373B7|nr:hypothetical protein [Bradyrhizobium pachyrhizi]